MSTQMTIAQAVRVQRSRGLPAESIRALRQAVVFEALEARRVLSATLAGGPAIQPIIDAAIACEPTTPSDDSGDASSDNTADDTSDDSTDATAGDDDSGSDVTDQTADDSTYDATDTATDGVVETTAIFDDYVDVTTAAPVIVASGKSFSGVVATFALGRGAASDFSVSMYLDDTDVSSAATIADNGDGTASVVITSPLDITHADGSAAQLSYGIGNDAENLYGYGSNVVIANGAGKGTLLVANLTGVDAQWIETSSDAQPVSIATVFDRSGADASAFQVTVDWGDGTTSPGTVEDNGDGTLSIGGDHAYAATGTYHVSATFTRADSNETLSLATDVAVNEPEILTHPIETIGGGVDWTATDGAVYTTATPRPYVRGIESPTATPTDVVNTPATPPTKLATRMNASGPAPTIVFDRSPSIASDMFGAEAIDSRFAPTLPNATKDKKDEGLEIV